MLTLAIEMSLLLIQFILLQTSGFLSEFIEIFYYLSNFSFVFPSLFVWTTLNYQTQKYLKILLKRKKANQKNLKSFTFLLFYVYEDETQGVYLS